MQEPNRCGWCRGNELYEKYHDEEWGVVVDDAQALFERLVLEGMQAGLAWITVLRKREHMRRAFHHFDIEKLARCRERDVKKWLANEGVIRHRGKLEAMINNAQLTLEQDGFPQLLWQFAPKAKIHRTLKTVPSETLDSQAMSKALKKIGYRFVGPTICYAFMQSVGMVNDHVTQCWRHQPCADLLANR